MRKREEIEAAKREQEEKINPFLLFISTILVIVIFIGLGYVVFDTFNLKTLFESKPKTTVKNSYTTSTKEVNTSFKSTLSTNKTDFSSRPTSSTTSRKTSSTKSNGGNKITTSSRNNNTTTRKTNSSSNIEYLDIEGDTNQVAVGGVAYLSVIVYPETAPNKKVTWKSSDTSVLTVDSNGKITGRKVGNAIITVTAVDGGKVATCLIKVVSSSEVIKVKSVSLANSEAKLRVGNTFTLIPTVSPRNATNPNVTWKSSNTNIAIVDAHGNVTAKNPGTVTITVKTSDGGKTASCKFTIVSE